MTMTLNARMSATDPWEEQEIENPELSEVREQALRLVRGSGFQEARLTGIPLHAQGGDNGWSTVQADNAGLNDSGASETFSRPPYQPAGAVAVVQCPAGWVVYMEAWPSDVAEASDDQVRWFRLNPNQVNDQGRDALLASVNLEMDRWGIGMAPQEFHNADGSLPEKFGGNVVPVGFVPGEALLSRGAAGDDGGGLTPECGTFGCDRTPSCYYCEQCCYHCNCPERNDPPSG